MTPTAGTPGATVPARRRRLLLLSTPLAIAVFVVAAKLISVALVGSWSATDYARGDAIALSRDVSILRLLNVIESAKAYYADGALAVLQGRLPDADRRFTEALARSAPQESCPVRVNLELIRETLGDKASAVSDRDTAVSRYTAAKSVVQQAPAGCFAGNNDPDLPRHQVRDDALRRLDAKIEALRHTPPLSSPPPTSPPPPPPSAAPAAAAPTPSQPARADPPRDDPMAGLAQILRDGAA